MPRSPFSFLYHLLVLVRYNMFCYAPLVELSRVLCNYFFIDIHRTLSHFQFSYIYFQSVKTSGILIFSFCGKKCRFLEYTTLICSKITNRCVTSWCQFCHPYSYILWLNLKKTDYYFSSSVCHYRTIFWPYRMSFKLFVPRFQILNSKDIKVRLQHTIKMLYGTQLSEFL